MKTIYILFFSLFLVNISIAQASAENKTTEKNQKKLVSTTVKSSKGVTSFEGVNELNERLKKDLILPSIVQAFNLEGKVKVRVDLDESGKLIKTSIIKGLEESVDQSILDVLNKIEMVNPIIIKGKATAKSIELSVVIKP